MADSGTTPAEVGINYAAEDGGVASAIKARRTKVTKDPVPGVSGVLKRKKPSVRPSPRPLKRKMAVSDETHENEEIATSSHVGSAEVVDDIQVPAEETEDTSGNCNCTLSRNLSSMRSLLHKEIASRDVLLQKLEESVTRMAEEMSSLKECMKTKMQEEMDFQSSQTEASAEGTPLEGDLETVEQGKIIIRNRCIEAMMSMTEILEKTEEKTSEVKVFYETIYDKASETSYILRILEKHRGLKIFIDCDSKHIGRLKQTVADLDGNKRKGIEIQAFADFLERRVYAGGQPKYWYDSWSRSNYHPAAAALVDCLMQFAMNVIFRNKGCPYASDDKFMEKVYEKIVEEALSDQSKVKDCSKSFKLAHEMNTQMGREVMLISAIPGYLLLDRIGDPFSNSKLHFLNLFFKQHVVPKMMDYLRE